MKRNLLRRKPRRVLRLPDLDHSKSAVLTPLDRPSHNEPTGTRSMISLHGTVQSQGLPSTGPSFCAIDYRWRLSTSRHLPSMYVWQLSEGLHTRLLTADYSAQS